MDLERLQRYASIYHKLASFVKEANILQNMAARVLWSTMPWQVQQQNAVALLSLVPGAKELLHYGKEAVMDEADNHTDPAVVQRLQSIQNLVEFFQQASRAFADEGKWQSQYGGQNWAKISKGFVGLAAAVQQVDQLSQSGNYQERDKALNEMVAYMNIIDATMHNSGTLIDKLLDLEANEHGNYDLEKRNKMYDEVLQIMDAKELGEPDDVISVVLPVVKTMPERYLPFKDWASQYYYKGQPASNVEEQLSKVRIQKLFQEAEHALQHFDKTETFFTILELVKALGLTQVEQQLRQAGVKNLDAPTVLEQLRNYFETNFSSDS